MYWNVLFCFLSDVPAWRWVSPKHPMLPPSGNQFKCHEEVLHLQPRIPPPTKFFEIFPRTGGCSEGLDAFRFFFRINTIRKEKSYDVLSVQRENANGTKNIRKKRHLKINKREKERNMCGNRGACVSKNDWTKDRGFNENMKTKTKQNKTTCTL